MFHVKEKALSGEVLGKILSQTTKYTYELRIFLFVYNLAENCLLYQSPSSEFVNYLYIIDTENLKKNDKG